MDGATASTICGTIDSLNPNPNSVPDQTYSIPCPEATEPTVSVLLYDDVMEGTGDLSSDWLIMNIAEIIVYDDWSPGKY